MDNVIKVIPGYKAIIDTSDIENWLKYDAGWIMPECMKLGTLPRKTGTQREVLA